MNYYNYLDEAMNLFDKAIERERAKRKEYCSMCQYKEIDTNDELCHECLELCNREKDIKTEEQLIEEERISVEPVTNSSVIL